MFKPWGAAGAVAGLYPALGIDQSGVADATDSLLAAVAAASVNGGVAQMPSGRVRLTGPIDVPSGVVVRGLGGDAFKGSVSDPAFDPATLVVYDGPSGGDLFRCKRVNGSAFEGFAVDGQNKVGRVWRLSCWQGGHLRDLATINCGSQNSPTVHGLALEISSDSVVRYTGNTHGVTNPPAKDVVDGLVGYLGLPANATYDLAVGMTVTGTGIPGGTTIAAILSASSIQLSANATADGTGVALTFQSSTGRNSHAFHASHLNLSAAQCIYLEGDSTADPCIGTFERVQMLYGSGSGNEDCVNAKTADNITWLSSYAFRNFGTGYSFHGQDGARNHHMIHAFPTVAGMRFENPTSAVWGNRVDGYQRGDAAIAPSLAANANLSWTEDGTSTGQRAWNLIKTASKRVTLTYSTPVVIDANLGNMFDLTVTNATAFTVGNPTNLSDGQLVYLTIRNTTAGALGAATFNTTWKIAAWVQPGAGTSRTLICRYDGTNLVEIGRTPADVPN